MTKINIQGLEDIDDPFYRYKMNQFVVEKIKNTTEIKNLGQVAKDLDRDPSDIIKFVGKNIGSRVIIKNNCYYISKIVSADDLYKIVRQYIEKYVLCPICRLPETKLGPEGINLCICCGYNGKKVKKK